MKKDTKIERHKKTDRQGYSQTRGEQRTSANSFHTKFPKTIYVEHWIFVSSSFVKRDKIPGKNTLFCQCPHGGTTGVSPGLVHYWRNALNRKKLFGVPKSKSVRYKTSLFCIIYMD